MDQPVASQMPLSRVPIGAKGRIATIGGGSALHLRLLGLGLRVGSEVEILHHRGRGVVVATAGTRIALGGGVADKLVLEPLPQPQPA